MATANSLLTIAESYIGYKEYPANSNKTMFNEWYYGNSTAAPWCCTFATFCGNKAGHITVKYASCGAFMEWAKKKGYWHDGYKGIKRGAYVMYKFTSPHDHIGIVKSVGSSSIVAIEGNTSSGNYGSQDNGGGVFQRTRAFSKIYGYVFVPFDEEPSPQPVSGDPIVKAGQEASIRFTGVSIACDGLRGQETRRQAVRVLQKAINLDYNKKLSLDGVIGVKTRTALGTHYVKYGEKQYMVTAAEILLMMLGRDPHGVEYPGIFGSGLQAAANKSKITASDFISYTK